MAVRLIMQKVETVNHFETGQSARVARVKTGKSLRKIAKKLGFSAAYVSDLERGRKNWNEKLLRRFVKALQ